MEFRNELILEYHNQRGHPGRQQTFENLAQHWWWPGMYTAVRAAVNACQTCRENDAKPMVSAWTRTTLYSHPFQALEFDFLAVPSSKKGNDYLLVVVCLFSRWTWAIPCQGATAEETARALLDEVFAPNNIYPDVLRSDNARALGR